MKQTACRAYGASTLRYQGQRPLSLLFEDCILQNRSPIRLQSALAFVAGSEDLPSMSARRLHPTLHGTSLLGLSCAPMKRHRLP